MSVCSSYEQALERFNAWKTEFRNAVDPIMDGLTEEEVCPGYICISDGEEQYALILSRSL